MDVVLVVVVVEVCIFVIRVLRLFVMLFVIIIDNKCLSLVTFIKTDGVRS